MILRAEEEATKIITDAAHAAFIDANLPAFVIERPSNPSFGDFSANAAMVWAKTLHQAPLKIAEEIAAKAVLSDSYFDSIEVAGAGFINFRVAPSFYCDLLAAVFGEGERYGSSRRMAGEKIMVEYVSANPTGPMHMGNARGAAVGDCIAELLSFSGADVTREFYVNDSGNQIERFALSLEARYLQHFGRDCPVPSDGYQGADITERAAEYASVYGDSLLYTDEETRRQKLVEFSLVRNINDIKSTLEKYRIFYDVWFYESSLYRDKLVEKVIAMLDEKGLTYTADGAKWLRRSEAVEQNTDSEYKDEETKDEVLVRSNGNYTYYAADIAYHYNKFALRSFDRVINVWGADHHGHVARLKEALDDLGLDGSNRLDIVLMQLVRLVREGQPVKMSKRTGKAISLVDLLEETSIDAARFFFNMKSPSSGMDFDLDLAVEQSSQNPVFYVQYAHARICSLVATLKDDGYLSENCPKDAAALLTRPEELSLLRFIALFPKTVYDAAYECDPSNITHYATELAGAFHSFYNACRIRGGEEKLVLPRLALADAVRHVLSNALGLLKVEAPVKM